MDNKNIFAANLNRYMKLSGKSRREISDEIGVSYYTFTDWVKGKKYPRMDRVEQLANYFGILKSDLIEEKSGEHREMQKKNDILADITLKIFEDEELFSIMESISKLNPEKRKALKAFLGAFESDGK